jgi:cytochrome P450
LLLAGEDTTAYTPGWAVHHLCDSAASLQALRRELDAVLGASDVPDDFETANRLGYAGRSSR